MDVFAMERQSDCANFDVRQKSSLKNNALQKSALKSAILCCVMPYFSALKASIFIPQGYIKLKGQYTYTIGSLYANVWTYQRKEWNGSVYNGEAKRQHQAMPLMG
jgi:hypothetical protein